MNKTEVLKEQACKIIEAMTDDLVELSHELHAHPELAFEEHVSAGKLAENAESAGLSVQRGAYGLETAFAAEFGDASKPRIAVLSEYDALPDIGHACGHNVIAAIGLGTARALFELGTELPGYVRYLGTPAEESGCGKELMAQHGAFDGMDAAMMLHPAGINAKAIRTLCISEVKVSFFGRAAHAAVSPETGRNAADAVMLAYMAIGQLRQHLAPGQMVHGVVTDASRVPNVIPGKASARYFVRAANAEQLAALKLKVENCFKAGALATGCDLDLSWALADYLDMKVNHALADRYEANAQSFGQEFVPYESLPLAGTDMSNVSHRVPTLHPLIAISPPSVMIHDAEFTKWARSDRADVAIVEGAKALALTAIDIMTDPVFLNQVTEEFSKTSEISRRAVEFAYNPGGEHGSGCCGCGAADVGKPSQLNHTQQPSISS